MKDTLLPVFRKVVFQIAFLFFLVLNTLIFFIPNLFLRLTKTYILIFNGLGIGDALSFTSAIKHLTIKENGTFIVASHFPDVFCNLHGVIRNIEIKSALSRTIAYFVESSIHSNIISCYGGNLYYKRFGLLYDDEYSYYGNILRNNRLPLMHVFLYPRMDFLDKVKGIDLTPIITLTRREQEGYGQKFKALVKTDFSIVHSGTSSIIKSKNVGYSKMNGILRDDSTYTNWVQVGSIHDKLLSHISLDLRGATSLRELFFLTSQSKSVLTNEGLMTHVSAAFNVPCITIYTGYHYPEISLYDNIIPITPNPLPDCAYCFKETCPYSSDSNRGECSKQIKVSKILKELQNIS